jgi:lipopolysaccharide/colanic/teichoic acid biosynthesis glycosyltransferase
MIKLTSYGTIFYLGTRTGKNGKPFKIIKFRSLVHNAEKIGGHITLKKDPRITKIGKFLRKYKLDELPQLINVLTGRMSFVGPRPEVPEYIEMLPNEQKKILTVKPGITDWASLKYYNEAALLSDYSQAGTIYTEKILPDKINLQLKYVNEQSFWIDFKIIMMTVARIFKVRKNEHPIHNNNE